MDDKSGFITLLRYAGKLIPGNYLKTFFYLNLVHRPRKLSRLCLESFYRMDHIYEVIGEFTTTYKGNFSILEFGVADGYAFTKKLYATRYLKASDRIVVHGFDTFEGMPPTDDERDLDLVAHDGWVPGQFRSSYDELHDYCSARYENFALHRGFFRDTLAPEFLATLVERPPILIWMDADYYTSTREALERLIPWIPNGCVIYFDEPEFNHGSRFTGESRVIHEVNSGKFGKGLELVLDRGLALNSIRVYRFINTDARLSYERWSPLNHESDLRRRSNDSPLP